MPHENFPFYSVKGSSYEQGYQHGKLAFERVFRSSQLYRHELLKRNVSETEFHWAAECMKPMIQAFEPEYYEEMKGIADGSGMQLDEIILINCRTEMLYCGNMSKLKAKENPVTDGCTGLVVLPSKSQNNRILHGHNWDWLAECCNTSIILKISKLDGNELLTFLEAGSLARHGFNRCGLSLSGNFLSSQKDYTVAGTVPLVLLRRKVLEAKSIAEALSIISSTRRFCSNNLILAQSNGTAMCVEMSTDDYFCVKPSKGLLVHANHWLSPEGKTNAKSFDGAIMKSSLGRQRKIEEILSNRDIMLGWKDIKFALSDTCGKPHGVCSFPTTSEFGETATVATILMEPESRKMWVNRNPYEFNDDNCYNLGKCYEL